MPVSIRSTYSTRLASSKSDLQKVKKILVRHPPSAFAYALALI